MANEFNPTLQPTTVSPSISGNKLKGANSTLETVSNLGKLAIGAYAEYDKGQVLSELDKRLNSLNQEYFDRNPAYLNAEEQSLAQERTATALDQYALTQNPTFQTGEEIDQRYNQLDAKVLELDDKLKKLQIAKQQGALTSFEFDIRSKDITRALVAENPHLTSDLITRLNQNLGLSTIPERLKFDEALAKNAQAAQSKWETELWNEADKRNIPVPKIGNTDQPDYRKLEQQLMKDRAEDAAYEIANQAFTTKQHLDQVHVNDLIDRDFHTAVTNGSYKKAEASLVGLFNDPSQSFESKMLAAKKIVSDQKTYTRDMLSKYSNDQRIKDQLTFSDNRFDTLLSSMESFHSLEDAKKYFANEKTILDDQQNIEVLKQFPVAETKFIVGTINQLGVAGILQSPEGSKLIKGTINLVQNILSDSLPTEKDFNKNTATKDSNFNTILKSNIKEVAQGNLDNTDLLNKTISSYMKGLNSPEVTSNPNDYFKRSEDLVKIFSTTDGKLALEHLDENSKGHLLDTIDTYNRQIANSLTTNLQQAGNVNINLTIAGDGTLLARGATPEFNANIVSRINQGLTAYANLHGLSKKEASKEFYSFYYNDAFTKPQAPTKEVEATNNPANLLGADKRSLESFASVEEGIRASVNRVSEIYNKQYKQSVKDIISELYPQSSLGPGVDQKEIIKSISKIMEVSPTQRINLTDKTIFSKFMSSIYSLYGNNISYQKVYASSWPNESEKIAVENASIEERTAKTAEAFTKLQTQYEANIAKAKTKAEKQRLKDEFYNESSRLWHDLKGR